jgi:hypothetical protein
MLQDSCHPWYRRPPGPPTASYIPSPRAPRAESRLSARGAIPTAMSEPSPPPAGTRPSTRMRSRRRGSPRSPRSPAPPGLLGADLLALAGPAGPASIVTLVTAVAIAVAASGVVPGIATTSSAWSSGRPMKAIDLVGAYSGACRSSRRQHGPHTGPAAVALPLRLRQRADRAGRLPPRGPHALVRLPARRASARVDRCGAGTAAAPPPTGSGGRSIGELDVAAAARRVALAAANCEHCSRSPRVNGRPRIAGSHGAGHVLSSSNAARVLAGTGPRRQADRERAAGLPSGPARPAARERATSPRTRPTTGAPRAHTSSRPQARAKRALGRPRARRPSRAGLSTRGLRIAPGRMQRTVGKPGLTDGRVPIASTPHGHAQQVVRW